MMTGLSHLKQGSWKGGLFGALVGTQEMIVIFLLGDVMNTDRLSDKALMNIRVINKQTPRSSFYGILTFVAVLTTTFLRVLS
jgi:hypothetical protein